MAGLKVGSRATPTLGQSCRLSDKSRGRPSRGVTIGGGGEKAAHRNRRYVWDYHHRRFHLKINMHNAFNSLIDFSFKKFCLWRVLEHLASTVFCASLTSPTWLLVISDYSLARIGLPCRQAHSREIQLDLSSLYLLMKQPKVASRSSTYSVRKTLLSETTRRLFSQRFSGITI